MATALMAFAPLSVAQDAEPPAEQALRFDIQRFQVEGNTLLKPALIERVVAPYIGKQKDFTDIQRALEAMETAYKEVGYGSVQVLLPEQNIASGVVRVDIVEPRIGLVTVEGAERYDAASVRRAVPALREGQVPNSLAIARNLVIANENPARQQQVLMRSGETDDVIDAAIKVSEDKPWKASFALDNTGTSSTGDYRVSFGYQNANMFNRDHLLTMQYITSPDHIGDVKVYGFGYKIPLYDLGSAIEFIGGYSNVNAGNVSGLFSVAGSGTIGGVRLYQYFDRIGNLEHKLVYSIDYKAFQNQVLSAGQSLVPDVTVHPIGLTYQGTYRQERSELNFYLGISQNVYPHGSDANDAAFKASRADAMASYRLYRYGFFYTLASEDDWQTRLLLAGQYTSDALVTGEQFGIGGADNVRGFLEREYADDKGYRTTAELYTPNIGTKVNLPDTQTRLLAFYDTGNVRRISPQPGESYSQGIGSVGMGVRIAGKYWTSRFDFARVIDPGPNETSGHTRLHLLLSAAF